METVDAAKARLDAIIAKGRVDLYKPIQIAEVLHRCRTTTGISAANLETYRNASKAWRNDVSLRLLGKISTSSARYQDDVWNETAMPPSSLAVLDAENRATQGAVERYIYLRFQERQDTVATIFAALEKATPGAFALAELLALFVAVPGLRRSIDRAYEIVTYALLDTIVKALSATVTVAVPESERALLTEFADLAQQLLGVTPDALTWTLPARIYRAGTTNAADKGLDMWANFGPAIQVKHLTLDAQQASRIVDETESDHVVIVCRDADAAVLQTVLQQIGWGRRVRGVVRESDLIGWYERCLRGPFADRLAVPLLDALRGGFRESFAQVTEIVAFLEERGYLAMQPTERWQTETDTVIALLDPPAEQP